MRIRKKEYRNQDVWEAARDRVRYLYKRFDKIVLSFSGGKDSTSVLHVALSVAAELGKLPLKVYFVDEEAIDPETIAYVARVRQRPDVSLEWYCLPIKHRNACSIREPFWTCWNPAERHLWVREMPSWAITTDPAFVHGMDYQEWMKKAFTPDQGTVCVLTGIRTQESMRRYQVIARKRNDSYITTSADNLNTYRAHPIYDWSTEDVWTLIHKFGFDYNKAYDVFNRTDLHNKLLAQRICQPFGEEPVRRLDLYAQCFPDMWSKLVMRVPGVNTAYRYSRSELFQSQEKPDNMSWQEFTWQLVEMQRDVETREMIRASIMRMLRRHARKTPMPVDDSKAHPISGLSWRFLAKIAARGDLKGRTENRMLNEALTELKKQNLTLEEAIKRYGHGGSAVESGPVGSPGQPETEPLQPERGRSTGVGPVRTEHPERRLDATDSGLRTDDSGRLPSVDGERTSAGLPDDRRDGSDGADSGQGREQQDGRDGSAQPGKGRSRRLANGRFGRSDVEERPTDGSGRGPDGDGGRGSNPVSKPKRNSTKRPIQGP